MNPEREESSQTLTQERAAPARGPEEFLRLLLEWKGAPEAFWGFVLAAQCRLAGAAAAAIFRAGADSLGVVAVHPGREKEAEAREWTRFTSAAAETLEAGRAAVKPLAAHDDLYGQSPRRYLALVPLPSPDPSVRLAGAYLFSAGAEAALERAVERLEWTAGLLRVAGVGSELERRQTAISRLSTAIETLGAVNEHLRFAASAMCLCNELAARWSCERVSLGFLRGRTVRLRALSHTEKFSRKMELVQEIETVMEECLDQDVEVLLPAPASATYGFREAAKFASRHGPACVLSLPLRNEGKVVGVLTIERPADRPFTAQEVETLRLACDLCAPRLATLEKYDRWVGARLAAGLRSAAAGVVGPTHTGVKLVVLAIIAFILFAVLAKGDYQAEASFYLESDHRFIVSARLDEDLVSVYVVPGDPVCEGNVLASFKTLALEEALARAKADRANYLTQVSMAMAADKTAEAQIAQAQADGAGAQIDLLEYKLRNAHVLSPVSGVVLSGDLQKVVPKSFRVGDPLFEVAPAGDFRAELLVPEDQIADVRDGGRMKGTLATASKPEDKVAFVVERIEPVAEVVNQKNVFRVRARLLETRPWMRLGLEGLAKIDVDRRSYAWLWTRPLVNWIRMKLWI